VTGTANRHRLLRQAGFTLVEALVAITLLSLLTITLTAALRFGLDAWARGAVHSDGLSRTLAVQGLLRDIVGQAYPYFVSSDPTHPFIDFDGTPQSLTLLAPAPIALGITGRSRFRLSVANSKGLSDLILTSQPELADAPSANQTKTLLTGTASIAFAYFGGQSRSEAGGGWSDRWTEQAALPRLVRIQVHFPEGDARLWPDLVIAPRILADVSCVYDEFTKLCRGR
jgi:general secretion pathway protein J